MAKEQTKQIEIIRNTMAGGKPVKIGQKVTLPAQEAQSLIHIGKAKNVELTEDAAPPAEKPKAKEPATGKTESPFEKMKVDELKAFAAQHEIELPAGAKKAKIVEIILATMPKKETADNSTEPAAQQTEGAGNT